jgi:putative transposase
MPWSHTAPMDQKPQGIADDLRDRLSLTERCGVYGVSRTTGYTGMDRSLTPGPQGLDERSRRPRTAPRHTPDSVAAALLDARQRQPSGGATTLVAILSTRHPRGPWPARSTVWDLLSRKGCGPTKRQRRALGPPGTPLSQSGTPNDVWSADVKGHFTTDDGRYGSPLTIADGYSRLLLSCQARSSARVAEATPVFTRGFKACGLPKHIRTDKGVPFAPTTLARLSPWSAWWGRLGR